MNAAIGCSNLYDLSFIQNGRQAELDAVDGGRRPNEMTIGPLLDEAVADVFDDAPVAQKAVDDIQETAERMKALDAYVPQAERAFRERGLTYPFSQSVNRDSLTILPGREDFARRCAELTEMVGLDNASGQVAKKFEIRAVKALHRLMGGWAICVGAPRTDKSGPAKAVRRFRRLLREEQIGYLASSYPTSGDLGADAFWILGRAWGGPVAYFQAKNTAFSLRDIAQEFLRISEVLRDWFGRRIDQRRCIIPVYAVNTVFTAELKERVFEAAGAGRGYHVIDAVDILHAESMPHTFRKTRDLLHIM